MAHINLNGTTLLWHISRPNACKFPALIPRKFDVTQTLGGADSGQQSPKLCLDWKGPTLHPSWPAMPAPQRSQSTPILNLLASRRAPMYVTFLH